MDRSVGPSRRTTRNFALFLGAALAFLAVNSYLASLQDTSSTALAKAIRVEDALSRHGAAEPVAEAKVLVRSIGRLGAGIRRLEGLCLAAAIGFGAYFAIKSNTPRWQKPWPLLISVGSAAVRMLQII